MLNMGVLICMAGWQELKEEDANFKGNQFRFGDSIKKYIEAALAEKMSVYERLDTKADIADLNILEKRFEENLQLRATKEQVDDLKLELLDLKNNYASMILRLLPPDNEERRKIIENNKYDHDKCIEELEKDSKKCHLKLVN